MEGIARAAQIYAQEIRGQRYIEMEKEARVSVRRPGGRRRPIWLVRYAPVFAVIVASGAGAFGNQSSDGDGC